MPLTLTLGHVIPADARADIPLMYMVRTPRESKTAVTVTHWYAVQAEMTLSDVGHPFWNTITSIAPSAPSHTPYPFILDHGGAVSVNVTIGDMPVFAAAKGVGRATTCIVNGGVIVNAPGHIQVLLFGTHFHGVGVSAEKRYVGAVQSPPRAGATDGALVPIGGGGCLMRHVEFPAIVSRTFL